MEETAPVKESLRVAFFRILFITIIGFLVFGLLVAFSALYYPTSRTIYTGESLGDVLPIIILVALLMERSTDSLLYFFFVKESPLSVNRKGVISKQATSYILGVSQGVIISIVGVRILDKIIVAPTSPQNESIFILVDVVFTSLVLASGSEGIHHAAKAYKALTQRVTTSNTKKQEPSPLPQMDEPEDINRPN